MTPAIYRRVSTDKQDDSLELQEKRAEQYCAYKFQQSVPPDRIFSDPDTSGRIPLGDRPGGRVLMNRLRAGDITDLVIAKIDRLGRNAEAGLGVLRFLKERNITLHIIDLGGETITTQGHFGKLMLTLLLAVAEWEVEEIRDRTRKQMKEIFDRGGLTGNVPFGYDCLYTFADGTSHTSGHALSKAELNGRKVDSKLLVDNPSEQNILRFLHRLRQGGMALNKIAAAANESGYVTKLGRPWSTGAVDSVLNSRHTQVLLGLQASAADQAEAA